MKKETRGAAHTGAEYTEHLGYLKLGKNNTDDLVEFGFGKEPEDKPILLDPTWMTFRLSRFQGKLLTLVEATVDSDKQKATKDIMKDYFSEFMFEIDSLTNTLEYIEAIADATNSK